MAAGEAVFLLPEGGRDEIHSSLTSFFLCSRSICLMLLSGVGRSSGMVPPKVFDGLADGLADCVVCKIGGVLILDMIAAELLIRLRCAEEVGGKFGAAHVVEDFLAFLQDFALSGIFYKILCRVIEELLVIPVIYRKRKYF